jgi:NAD(P)-dependent dehydrogenase (short-subunit alcohol dehydrogenase family)
MSDEISFDGRVAIVTGAGGGLGRSHALLLAERGASIVVNDLGGDVHGNGGSDSAAQKVVDEIKARGGNAIANHDSVATPDGGRAIVKTAVDAFGKVDIVINNAGILRDKAFHKMDDDMINAVIDVHLKGAFFVTKPAFEIMRDQGYGRIVSTTSGTGLFGNFGQSNYGAAKAGLVGLTRTLSLEGAMHNIKANVIAPIAGTRMTEDILGPDLFEQLTPESVSPIVAYLASEACDVSSYVYSVAGARIARVFQCEGPDFLLPEPTPEAVRDNLATINGPAVPMPFLEFASLTEETVLLAESLSRTER